MTVTCNKGLDVLHIGRMPYTKVLDELVEIYSQYTDMKLEEFLHTVCISDLPIGQQARLCADVRRRIEGGNTIYFHDGRRYPVFSERSKNGCS